MTLICGDDIKRPQILFLIMTERAKVDDTRRGHEPPQSFSVGETLEVAGGAGIRDEGLNQPLDDIRDSLARLTLSAQYQQEFDELLETLHISLLTVINILILHPKELVDLLNSVKPDARACVPADFDPERLIMSSTSLVQKLEELMNALQLSMVDLNLVMLKKSDAFLALRTRYPNG